MTKNTKTNIKWITARSNAYFRKLKELLSGPGIKEQGRFLISGERLVRELFEQRPEVFLEAIVPPETVAPFSEIKTVALSAELFRELDVFGTKFPLLVGQVPTVAPVDLSLPPQRPELVVALGDPANLGALLRSAEAFGIENVILLTESANPFHPKAVRASSGSVLRLHFFRGPSIRELSKCPGLIALDLEGESLVGFDWPTHFRLLVGQEGLGVPKGLNATRLKIPMAGKVESLNGAIAASLALFSRFGKK